MQLPNARFAYVPLPKLTAYLLSETHAVGRAKARFFCEMGFCKEHPDMLMRALLEVAETGEVRSVVETPYGMKYVVDGALPTPVGKRVHIRTVWIVETGRERPRFVTAYPVAGA